jgi:alkanesulfonate monooxygenase SsuD/methylene tetrahydromethanopterin reductase-like flavin-dependent oxidoreductase (luciferase family)
MEFDILSLGDHLPLPGSDRHYDSQADRHALWVEMGRLGEKLGFRGIQFGEHHDSEYIISSPQMILAAIASQTSRIKLGTGVSLLANIDPVRVAEDFATLDLLSRGRAEVGFGSGIEENVFRLFGQDASNRKAMMAENRDLLHKLWNDRDLTWSGRFRADLRGVRLEPRTFSGRSLPVARGTATLDTAKAIGTAGDQLLLPTMLGSFDNLKSANVAYREAYHAAGHDPKHIAVSGVAYVFVGSDGPRAREYFAPFGDNYSAMVGREFARHKMNPDIAKLAITSIGRVIDLACCGTPEEVAAGIVRASAAVGGLERMTCMFDLGGLPSDVVLNSIGLFAQEVMPRVVEATAAVDNGSRQLKRANAVR